MKNLLFLPLSILIIFSFSACTSGSKHAGNNLAEELALKQKLKFEAQSMDDVIRRIQALRDRWKPGEILIIFDIDNTVLTMNQELGSDQWFTWQNEMLKGGGEKRGLITNDFTQLLGLQYEFYSLSQMIPPEMATPLKIRQLRDLGHPVIALTSRGYPSQGVTQGQLRKHDLVFSKNFDSYFPSGSYLPKDDGKISKPLSYVSGVFFTAGQNKGKMIKHFLKKTKTKPKAIVFVDDHLKHTLDVQKSFSKSRMSVTTFHYQREKINVDRFFKGPGRNIARIQWNEIRSSCKSKQTTRTKSLLRAIFALETLPKSVEGICKYAQLND